MKSAYDSALVILFLVIIGCVVALGLHKIYSVNIDINDNDEGKFKLDYVTNNYVNYDNNIVTINDITNNISSELFWNKSYIDFRGDYVIASELFYNGFFNKYFSLSIPFKYNNFNPIIEFSKGNNSVNININESNCDLYIIGNITENAIMFFNEFSKLYNKEYCVDGHIKDGLIVRYK